MGVLWNPTNPRDSEQNLCSHNFMKTALQGKDLLHNILVHKFFMCRKRWRFQMRLTKIRAQEKEVILEALRETKKKVHVVCYLQIASLWWTSSWCSVYLHTSKIGGCSKIASKFPNLNVQMFGFCQYMWMALKWLERFRIWSHVIEIDDGRWSWRSNIISSPCILGVHS